MPQRLLPLLTVQPQSGESLGQRLGLGRVTIRTLAHQLQEQGVPVVVSRAGYALAAGTPAPKLVPIQGVFGQGLRYLGTVDSTQDELRRWANAPAAAPHGAVVVAERQTAGRGRRGRAWDTTSGTLAFSVLLRQPYTFQELSTVPLAAGVAVQTAVGLGGLKWPNDLLAPDGRKLAGILLEAEVRGEEVRQAVLGIGVNVGAAPAGAAYVQEFNPSQTRAALLGEVLWQLEHWLSRPKAEMLSAWTAASFTLGQRVRVQTSQRLIEGLAEKLDEHGHLLVQTSVGLEVVTAGDVQLVGRW